MAFTNDWREQVRELNKRASMTATSDLDIEKAFSDQASGFVENKVGDLMKDEYRIGFEVVKKNEDNTRMVGVFAFKIDTDLVFAPVFFLNGEIKGPLLYRTSNRMFVPATKEWAAYLIEATERKDGKPRTRTAIGESAPLVQMKRLTFNPSTGFGKVASTDCEPGNSLDVVIRKVTDTDGLSEGVYEITKVLDTKPGEQPKLSTGDYAIKMASCEDCTIHFFSDGKDLGYLTKRASESLDHEETARVPFIDGSLIIPGRLAGTIKKAFTVEQPATDWDHIIEKVASQKLQPKLIPGFISDLGAAGKTVAEQIVKAASSDFEFANMLAALYPDPTEIIPDFTQEKKASATSDLQVIYDCDLLEKSASVSQKYFADGFYIKDTRPEETLSVVYENNPSQLHDVSEPGVYSILQTDGSFLDDVLVLREVSKYIPDNRILVAVRPSIVEEPDWNTDAKAFSVLIKDNKIAETHKPVVGIRTKEIKYFDGFTTTLSENNFYVIVLDGNFSVFIYIEKINSIDGVSYVEANVSKHNPYYGIQQHLVINKDLDKSSPDKYVYGSDAKFVRIEKKKTDREATVPNDLDVSKLTGSVDSWIFSTFHMPKVKVEQDPVEKKAYIFSAFNETGSPMNRFESLVKLARDLSIPAEKAYEIMDRVDTKGSAEFYITKVATRLKLIDRPIFDDEFDSEFGVPMQPTRAYALRVAGHQNMEPASAIGDMMNPTTATGLPNLTVATTAPEDLRSLADTYHLPNVFEHGLIGTLANTFNAVVMLDKYVPKIEEAVDVLGRTKFLIHWCPSDFEKQYGTDDMANMEAEVDANFEALGSLLLKLLKKADKQKRVEVSLTQDEQNNIN